MPIRPITIGSICSPDSVAVEPRTYCRYVGRNVIAPSIANPTMNASTTHTENTDDRNRRSGRIGSTARPSTTTKIASDSSEAADQQDDRRRAPLVLDAAPGQRQVSPAAPSDTNTMPEVVDGRPTARLDVGHREGRQHDHGDADGQVDVEDPPPRQVVGQQPAEQRPQHRGHTEDGAERTLILAPLAQRDDVGDDRGRRHHQQAAAEPLHRPPARSATSSQAPARTWPRRPRTGPPPAGRPACGRTGRRTSPPGRSRSCSASRYDDTTHDRCSAPPRSPTIVGSAVDTMVWSSAASSIPAMIVPKIRFILRRVIGSGCASLVGAAASWTVTGPSPAPPRRRECATPRRPLARRGEGRITCSLQVDLPGVIVGPGPLRCSPPVRRARGGPKQLGQLSSGAIVVRRLQPPEGSRCRPLSA